MGPPNPAFVLKNSEIFLEHKAYKFDLHNRSRNAVRYQQFSLVILYITHSVLLTSLVIFCDYFRGYSVFEIK